MSNNIRKPLGTAALGALFVGSLAAAPMASAVENPFGMQSLQSGYAVANNHARGGEGRCGEGRCGGSATQQQEQQQEQKGREGKCGEGRCGGAAAGDTKQEQQKTQEGKCGEGRCGSR